MGRLRCLLLKGRTIGPVKYGLRALGFVALGFGASSSKLSAGMYKPYLNAKQLQNPKPQTPQA